MKAWNSLVLPFVSASLRGAVRWRAWVIGIYNTPSQQSLFYHLATAPLLSSQKVMEKYFCPILSEHAIQRLKSKESRKENTTTFRGLSLLQKSSLLHEKHHGAPAATVSIQSHLCWGPYPKMQESFGNRALSSHLPCRLYLYSEPLTSHYWLGWADNDMAQDNLAFPKPLPVLFCPKETQLLVVQGRSSVTVNGQCSVAFLEFTVVYTTQRSRIASEPLLCILCTLFLSEIRYHDLENRVNKNRYGFKLGIVASKV